MRPAGEAIAEADQLYAGRADLVKVRRGVVALRQAQAEDQANYELAWRLAKFNYYLGDCKTANLMGTSGWARTTVAKLRQACCLVSQRSMTSSTRWRLS